MNTINMRSRSVVIAAAILAVTAYAPVYAKSGNNGNGNGGCGAGQQTNGCGGTTQPTTPTAPSTNNYGGQGGAGGQGGQGGSAVASGGTANLIGSGNSTNANNNLNTNTNLNNLAQGQQQGQGQIQGQGQQQGQQAYGGSSSSSSASTSSSNSGGNTMVGGTQTSTTSTATTVNVGGDTYQAQARNPVSSAWAAPLAASNGTCLGSASGGAQTVGFGFSFGSTKLDEGCNARYDSLHLQALGLRDAAIARICQVEANAKAIEASGGKCPTKQAPAASLSYNELYTH